MAPLHVPSSDPVRRREDKWLGESRRRSEGSLPAGADHRATTLYAVGPHGPDHDAVMRIGGEAPGRRAHSRKRCRHHGLLRVTAPSDRQRRPTMSYSSGLQNLSCPHSPVTLLARQRQPAPRPWSPFATGQSAAFSRGPRSRSCACRRGRRPCAPGTTGQRTLLLMKQKAPGQLDHPAADSGVARLGEPFFAPPAAALVG